MTESSNQARIRQHYSALGYRLWRNNRGVLRDARGVPVRFGLANDSKQLGDTLKSADLIGWRPVLVTPDMVGDVIARFVSIEAKPTGWSFPAPTNRDEFAHCDAQRRWARMVLAEGGEAGFMIDPIAGFERTEP